MCSDISSEEVDFDPFADDHQLLQVVPSTEAQREIWTSVQMSEKASCSFNESITLEFVGALQETALKLALKYVIQRHEALRTTFTPDGSSLCISETCDFALTETSGDEVVYEQFKRKEAETPFDLEKGPLIRFTLVNQGKTKSWLILTAHHIICDGWSLAILVQDLSLAYSAALKNLTVDQSPAFSFGKYAQKTSELLLESSDEAYWLDLFSGPLPVYDLPIEFERPTYRTFDASRLDYDVSLELINKVKKLAGKQNVSLTAFMLSAFYACLSKWSGEHDLVIGLPAATQPQYDSESLVGHCVNFLPLRIQLDDQQAFEKLLSNVSDLILDAYEHQNYTYGTLLQKLDIERDSSRIPLCPVSFNVDQGIQGKNLDFPGLDVNFHSNPRTFENFELFINASDYGDRFVFECQYNTNLFSEASITNRMREYCQVLTQLVTSVQQPLSSIQLLSDTERSTLLASHSNSCDYFKQCSIIELFELMTKSSPESIAVVCGEQSLSYQKLHQLSNQVASYLLENGVIPGSLIGICLDRSVDLLVILLGVLKTGAGYVPLDPEYPVDRLNFMLKDAGLNYLISQPDYLQRLSLVKHSFLIQDLLSESREYSLESPSITISDDSICYVIYTSGSTGQPKGVMVPHSSVSNFLQSMAEKPGVTESDTLLAVTTLSFDIAVLELYLPIVCGAKVVIATRDEVVDGNKLKALLDEQNISIMQATPATWRLLCNAGWQGNNHFKILCGGEVLPQDLSHELLNRSGQLWNMYGPTETTVWSTCALISDNTLSPTIGTAIANTDLYVLDNYYNVLPDGIAGELYIGGAGVTLGYLNRKNLTEDRYLKLPVADEKVLYRTGDKVRFLADGNLEYMGRLDSQVKLRGFRIELGEIESSIRQHDSVKDCAVVVQQKSIADERLICFLVAAGVHIEKNGIREFLSQTLPAYMIPQHFMTVDALPRTPNGKLDRKALPRFEFSGQGKRNIIEAQTDNERILATIWKDVLKISTIGIEDNFFDLGGHSLLIAKIIQKLEQECSVPIQYRDVFDNPTIKQLALVLDSRSGKAIEAMTNPIVSRNNKENCVLSLAQQRLWYLDKMEPESTHFNLPSAFKFIGNLNINALQSAFQQLINRHDILRTAIFEEDELPVQHIFETLQYSLPIYPLEQSPGQQELLAQRLDQLQRTTFDITEAPLFRAELISLTKQENVLFFMPHHMIFDGWSFDVFVHELTTLYSQNSGFAVEPLNELQIQYADYSIWLRNLLSTHELDRQLEYWKKTLDGTLPVLQMPTDFTRPEIATNKGAEIHFEIEETLFYSLEKLARSKEVSLFMLLMSSYLSLLYRYTGQTDLIVGAPMADRTRPGTENLIGFFVNALVLRFSINPEQSFADLLGQVKEVCLSGFANQDVPFETLVEHLNPERDLSHAPLFQTSVTYQDVTAREVYMGDIEIQQVEIPTIEAPLDINIWFKRRGSKVLGAVVYNTDLFHAESIHRFVESFQNILNSVARSWHQPIANLDMLTHQSIKDITALHNNTLQQWDAAGSTIHELFENQVVRSPDKVAAVCGTENITYLELSQRSNQLAHHLLQQGVQPGQMIGLCVDRSLNMLISLLGILKTGSCYIPLDPEFPKERLAYMVKDAGLEWIILQNQYTSFLPEVKNTIVVDALAQELHNVSKEAVELDIDTDSLAYVIYTSGSTGNPKGVMVHHGAVVNFLLSMSQTPGISVDDKLLAVTTLSFDIAVLELYLPIVKGATTVIASKLEATDGRRLFDLIKKQDISIMQATPATWRMLIAAGWDEIYKITALCGGEALTSDLARQLVSRTRSLWNMYGPTETTVWSTCSLIKDSDLPVSIGEPIANTRIYILDEKMQLVPQGVAGELYISGSGVTKGYLNNPQMTSERFLESTIETEGFVYRTGDKVRYRVDGSLEYISRIDHQVKVRGYRIELGEIESVLREHESINDCVVSVLEERAGDSRLVAYVVWNKDALTMTELRQFCKKWLPAYMIPQHVVDIEEIPKTPNGKLDRKKLPDIFVSPALHDNFVPPETEEQQWLAAIWKEIIGIDKVGKFDNFFELGGHSLLSMQVIHKIEEISGVIVNPRELLLDTLEQIASRFQLAPFELVESKKPKKGFLNRILNR